MLLINQNDMGTSESEYWDLCDWRLNWNSGSDKNDVWTSESE